MVSVYPLPAFADNYIWVVARGGDAMVIDPGDGEVVLRHLRQRRLTLRAILVTHHHADHVGGLPALLGEFQVPVYGPADSPTRGISQALREGDRITPADFDLELSVLEVPGHTLDHIAYHGGGRLFCGDTLFTCGCGRLFEGTPPQMYASLQKLASLEDDTLVFCAHEYTLANIRFARQVEPQNVALLRRETAEMKKRAADEPTVPSTLGLEKQTNPFLRCAEPSVRQRLQSLGLLSNNDHVEAFAALREWKNRS